MESKTKRNFIQMINDVFDDCAEREEAARTIASARAQASAGISGDADEDGDLNAVDAKEDEDYEAFLGKPSD